MMRGAVVLASLVAAGSALAKEVVYLRPSDEGRTSCGSAEKGWQTPAFDDQGWLKGGGRSDGGAATASCSGTRYLRYRFHVGSELGGLATVTVRLRYNHGVAVYLNGNEVARRRLAAGAAGVDSAALATETHGPEAESIVVSLRDHPLERDNLLALEVHPRTAGREPFVEAELVGADGPRLVRGPYLLRPTEHEMTVVFDTDLPTLGEVRYGPTASYGAVSSDSPPSMHHALTMRNLAPGTSYHYRVAWSAPAQEGEATAPSDAGDAHFHTPPLSPRPLHFVVYGDVRSGHDVHAQINRAIAAEEPDLALVTGDLVDRGSDAGDWERFFEVAAPLLREVAIFPAIGNHEYASLNRGAQSFFSFFRWPLVVGDEDPAYYSFDLSSVHFVALDSHQYRSPRQLSWFERDLAAANRREARAIFVFAHEGPFSSGMHGDNAICIHDYVPLMQRHHVTLFLGGHDHDFERGEVGGLPYVVTGGGGAELRPTRCGVPGRRPCPPRVQSFINEHNYVVVDVLPRLVRICPKRPDASPLEACTELALHPSRRP